MQRERAARPQPLKRLSNKYQFKKRSKLCSNCRTSAHLLLLAHTLPGDVLVRAVARARRQLVCSAEEAICSLKITCMQSASASDVSPLAIAVPVCGECSLRAVQTTSSGPQPSANSQVMCVIPGHLVHRHVLYACCRSGRSETATYARKYELQYTPSRIASWPISHAWLAAAEFSFWAAERRCAASALTLASAAAAAAASSAAASPALRLRCAASALTLASAAAPAAASSAAASPALRLRCAASALTLTSAAAAAAALSAAASLALCLRCAAVAAASPALDVALQLCTPPPAVSSAAALAAGGLGAVAPCATSRLRTAALVAVEAADVPGCV